MTSAVVSAKRGLSAPLIESEWVTLKHPLFVSHLARRDLKSSAQNHSQIAENYITSASHNTQGKNLKVVAHVFKQDSLALVLFLLQLHNQIVQ